MTPSLSRRRTCTGWALLTMAVGLAWRFVVPGLSPFWFKYGGSCLWAVMVYWIVGALEPGRRRRALAGQAALVALLVELFRLWHTPALDAFRLTLAGRLLLGRVFSWADVLAYWSAIAAIACVDRKDGSPAASHRVSLSHETSQET